MNKQITIPFPLLGAPDYYVAALNDRRRLDCTHVSIRLVPSTVLRLLWMHLVASTLRLVGIKSVSFETTVGRLAVRCLQYKGKDFLGTDDETSADETPYDCLSIGELASLGGYATDEVLETYFTLARINTKVYAVEIHAERFAMWFKVYFFGQIPSLETNPFNLDIIAGDFFKRSMSQLLTSFAKRGQK
ncbi:MAG TPA: hypothetical protein VLA72_13910 [Anaerolineales bacterium]|nr:hypothetical protein [Anaerolineales bacterium]